MDWKAVMPSGETFLGSLGSPVPEYPRYFEIVQNGIVRYSVELDGKRKVTYRRRTFITGESEVMGVICIVGIDRDFLTYVHDDGRCETKFDFSDIITD